MKKVLKYALEKVSPTLLSYVSALRFRRKSDRKYRAFQNEIAGYLFGDEQISVLGGPFVGMRYLNDIVWGPISPKWLGSYEEQLHPVVRKIIDSEYRRVIDVGAAEGYYAVGLAMMKPTARIFSFDTDPFARRLQKELVKINGLENLQIGRYCDHGTFNHLCRGQALVICDIEGGELELLDIAAAPNLRMADVLVEIHEISGMSVEEVAAVLAGRFQDSHEIEVVKPGQRQVQAYDAVAKGRIPATVMMRALDEDREQEQVWLWMTSRLPNR